MNKPFYIFLFLILFCCEAKTQTDYITNGSFEQIDSCYGQPANIGFDVFAWSGCTGWSNPIASSSDLWCENPKIGTFIPPSLPTGFQNAHSGKNFAGFLIGDAGNLYNYREYIQNKLSQSFVDGNNYEISFYVSSNVGSCNISEIGVKFYNQKLNNSTSLNLTNVIPDILNDKTNFITDTLDWKKIVLNYKANGFENYIVIGCFTDSTDLNYDISNCDTTGWIGQIFPRDYIYIDDVSIIELPLLEPLFPNIFTPNNDGVNDVWKIDLRGYENIQCNIYNRWGNKIYETDYNIILWDSRTTSGEKCSDGIYYYTIETKEKTFKGFIQLIR